MRGAYLIVTSDEHPVESKEELGMLLANGYNLVIDANGHGVAASRHVAPDRPDKRIAPALLREILVGSFIEEKYTTQGGDRIYQLTTWTRREYTRPVKFVTHA